VKVFVTGSNGFVGKSLIPFLKKKNFSVIEGNRELYGNISEQKNWEQFLVNVDSVVHLAARVHVMRDTTTDPENEFKVSNVDATIKLANAAKKCGVKRFVYLSSIKVNGEGTRTNPYTANDYPMPEDAYGRSKFEAEQELLKLHEKKVFEVVIIRPPLIYGPKVKANFQNLMKVVDWDIPLPFKLINNRRSLVSVLNLCDLIAVCLVHEKAGGEIFLVRDNKDYSLKDIIIEIARLKNKTPHLIPVPQSLFYFLLNLIGKKSFADRLLGNLHVDISKNKEILNWIPKYAFQETFKQD
jgi:UDP-glucose 4-epimerase